jgi:hypothetical protein
MTKGKNFLQKVKAFSKRRCASLPVQNAALAQYYCGEQFENRGQISGLAGLGKNCGDE